MNKAMKKLLLGAALIAIAFLTTGCSTQSNVTTNATSMQITQMLANGEYSIDFYRMDPLGGSSKTLTTPYNIQVSGGKVQSYLPYFGRAYSLPYGGGEGLSFTSDVTDYNVKPGKKKSQIVTFSARTTEDRYDFNIQVFENGRSYMTVTPNNKQSISFDGELMPVKENK